MMIKLYVFSNFAQSIKTLYNGLRFHPSESQRKVPSTAWSDNIYLLRDWLIFLYFSFVDRNVFLGAITRKIANKNKTKNIDLINDEEINLPFYISHNIFI